MSAQWLDVASPTVAPLIGWAPVCLRRRVRGAGVCRHWRAVLTSKLPTLLVTPGRPLGLLSWCIRHQPAVARVAVETPTPAQHGRLRDLFASIRRRPCQQARARLEANAFAPRCCSCAVASACPREQPSLSWIIPWRAPSPTPSPPAFSCRPARGWLSATAGARRWKQPSRCPSTPPRSCARCRLKARPLSPHGCISSVSYDNCTHCTWMGTCQMATGRCSCPPCYG